MLKFSKANSKLQKLAKAPWIKKYLGGDRKIYSLDLLAGHTCPYSNECLSKVVDGKIVDGPHTKFRCYAASLEVLYKAKFASDDHNTKLVRSAKTSSHIFSLLNDSMPSNLGVCRIHSSGDFFSQAYFDAWVRMAELHSDRLFYAYTKNLKVWSNKIKDIPANFVLTASYGGRLDHMIVENNLRYSKVIFNRHEAGNMPIDEDDSHAANPLTKEESFCLVLHGQQKKNSDAVRALYALKRQK